MVPHRDNRSLPRNATVSGLPDAIAGRARASRAWLFDMDGTLLNSEHLACDAFNAAARERGITIAPAAYARLIGHRGDSGRQILAEIVGSLEEAEGIFERANDVYARAIEEGQLQPMPGVEACLEALSRRGVPMAVVTSTQTALAREKLQRTGLAGAFGTVVGGDCVEHGKPAPDSYERAAQNLGFAPEACLAVEDSPIGLQAAHAAGCLTVLIPDRVPATAQTRALADLVLPTLLPLAQLAAGATCP